MIALPLPPSDIRLKSFCLATSLVGGLVLGSLFYLILPSLWLGVSMFLIISLGALGWRYPSLGIKPYLRFNHMVELVSRFAVYWVNLLEFIVVLIGGGSKKAFLQLERPGPIQSLWCVRASSGNDLSPVSDILLMDERPQNSWVLRFVQFSFQSRNWWWMSVLPFIFLLSVFGKDIHQTSVPTHTYTLF